MASATGVHPAPPSPSSAPFQQEPSLPLGGQQLGGGGTYRCSAPAELPAVPARLQVLYFIPGMRASLLAAMPDPEREFSLLDELALLFRMLASESGHACQATNLLRALRQSREATGLGLLEGHAQKGAHGADIEVHAATSTPPLCAPQHLFPSSPLEMVHAAAGYDHLLVELSEQRQLIGGTTAGCCAGGGQQGPLPRQAHPEPAALPAGQAASRGHAPPAAALRRASRPGHGGPQRAQQWTRRTKNR